MSEHQLSDHYTVSIFMPLTELCEWLKVCFFYYTELNKDTDFVHNVLN
jgi:hypothetical protein